MEKTGLHYKRSTRYFRSSPWYSTSSRLSFFVCCIQSYNSATENAGHLVNLTISFAVGSLDFHKHLPGILVSRDMFSLSFKIQSLKVWQGCKKESHLPQCCRHHFLFQFIFTFTFLQIEPQCCRHHSLFRIIFTFTFLQSSFSFTLTLYALSNYSNSSFCPDQFSLWLSILLSPHFQTTFAFLQVGILLYLATLLFNAMCDDLVIEWLWVGSVGLWTAPGYMLAAFSLVTDEASPRCWYIQNMCKRAKITRMKHRGAIRGWDGLDVLGNFWPLQNRTRSLRNIIVGALVNVGTALADLATGTIYEVLLNQFLLQFLDACAFLTPTQWDGWSVSPWLPLSVFTLQPHCFIFSKLDFLGCSVSHLAASFLLFSTQFSLFANQRNQRRKWNSAISSTSGAYLTGSLWFSRSERSAWES